MMMMIGCLLLQGKKMEGKEVRNWTWQQKKERKKERQMLIPLFFLFVLGVV